AVGRSGARIQVRRRRARRWCRRRGRRQPGERDRQDGGEGMERVHERCLRLVIYCCATCTRPINIPSRPPRISYSRTSAVIVPPPGLGLTPVMTSDASSETWLRL